MNSEQMPAQHEIARARLGVMLTFLAHGFLNGSFISRIPDLKITHGLSNSALGLCLLVGSLGVLSALGPAGRYTAKHGSARVVRITNIALLISFPFVGLAPSVPLLGLAFFITGALLASLDVAMNTHGVTLEQKSGKRFMGRFHAFWSVGGLTGTIVGGLFSQTGMNISIHFIVISVVAMLFAFLNFPRYLPTEIDKHLYSEEHHDKKKRPLLIFVMGLLGLAGSIGEGSAGDWGGVLARETFGASPFVSSLPYVAFSLTMVIGRFFGDQLATKFGANRILKIGGVIGGVGLAGGLFIGGSFGVILGWFLFGTALSAVIPLLFSAAGSMANKRFEGRISPAEAVAMISGISYFGFVVGPPMMGFLADAVSLRWAMLVPAVLAIIISASSRIFTED